MLLYVPSVGKVPPVGVPFTVKVEAADIANGTRTAPTDCAVARALKRTTGTGWNVQLTSRVGDARAWQFGCTRRIKLPYEAESFIYRFDSGHQVKPFAFTAVIEEL